MMTLGPLAFAAPWVLLALGLLPAIYWLLRVTPPPPRVMAFPPIRLLADLVAKEETPDRTPLWVLLLRLALAALLILGLSQPILNPPQSAGGSGTLVVLVENGWASGRDWPARQARLQTIIDTAQRSRQEI
ncbi:MAG: BatA domain-containing protein, partial [Pseudomonadota bacterium]